MSVNVRPNSRICYFGHSIVQGTSAVSVANVLALRLWASYTGARAGTPYYGVAPSNATLPAGYGPGVPRVIPIGHAGFRSDQLLAVVSQAYTTDPNIVIIQCEVNDAAQENAQATFVNSFNSMIDDLRVNCPNLENIILLQDVCDGELRPFGSNAHDTTSRGLAACDADLRTIASNKSVSLVQMRTDGSGNGAWLTYETAHNPSNLASGILTIDGVHPLTHPTLVGQNFIVDQLMTVLNVTGVG